MPEEKVRGQGLRAICKSLRGAIVRPATGAITHSNPERWWKEEIKNRSFRRGHAGGRANRLKTLVSITGYGGGGALGIGGSGMAKRRPRRHWSRIYSLASWILGKARPREGIGMYDEKLTGVNCAIGIWIEARAGSSKSGGVGGGSSGKEGRSV